MRRALAAGALAAALAAALLLPGVAAGAADPAGPEQEDPVAPVDSGAPRTATTLRLSAPADAQLGGPLRVRAVLRAESGTPVPGALVVFTMSAAWGDELQGDVVVARARTDLRGEATATLPARRTGDVGLGATFAGDGTYASATAAAARVAVTGSTQLYTPEVGVRVPGLGGWLIAVVIAAVWILYLTVAARLGIIAAAGARLPGQEAGGLPRRQFLGRLALPVGVGGVMGLFGVGLPTLVLRSPRTHGSLRTYLTHSRYRRSPFAPVERETAMRPMPPLLDRPVTYDVDVRDLLLRRGGPHAVLPKNSPPPAGVRLDSYEAIMAKQGLVVPGKPEESLLVEVLRNPAMNMPPSSSPLPTEEIQLIVTWIAQGAPRT